MKIDCANCGKPLKIEDGVDPSSVIKGKCSVCNHLFFLYPPPKPVQVPEESSAVKESPQVGGRKPQGTSESTGLQKFFTKMRRLAAVFGLL